MSITQQTNPQRTHISMLPGGGSGNRNPNIRTSERKPCVKCECNHPRQINPDPYERRKERARIKHYRKLAAQILKAGGIEI